MLSILSCSILSIILYLSVSILVNNGLMSEGEGFSYLKNKGII